MVEKSKEYLCQIKLLIWEKNVYRCCYVSMPSVFFVLLSTPPRSTPTVAADADDHAVPACAVAARADAMMSGASSA